MSEPVSVKVQLGDGIVEQATLRIGPGWCLTFSGIGMREEIFQGDDLFEAMISLRESLEPHDCILLCAGARVDVYPSGMSRSMGGGRKAYINKLGQPATVNDLVDIFEPAEPDSVGSVEEQRQFHKKWVESLRR